MDTANHIEVAKAGPCWHCGTPTRWVEIAFEAPLCPGPCTAAKWAEWCAYDRAHPLTFPTSDVLDG